MKFGLYSFYFLKFLDMTWDMVFLKTLEKFARGSSDLLLILFNKAPYFGTHKMNRMDYLEVNVQITNIN